MVKGTLFPGSVLFVCLFWSHLGTLMLAAPHTLILPPVMPSPLHLLRPTLGSISECLPACALHHAAHMRPLLSVGGQSFPVKALFSFSLLIPTAKAAIAFSGVPQLQVLLFPDLIPQPHLTP